jgi:hypothetical protein
MGSLIGSSCTWLECGELGHSYRHKKVHFLHGEWLKGGQYPSKKLVEILACNGVAGHTHAPQSYMRISPVAQL